MGTFEIITGDLFIATFDDPIIIAHVCNDLGKWGAGFSGELSKHYKPAEIVYRDEAKKNQLVLGRTMFVKINDTTLIANMISQHGIRTKTSTEIPLKYYALASSLEHLRVKAELTNSTVVMPKIGCGNAGGDWTQIQYLIKKLLVSKDINVKVFAF